MKKIPTALYLLLLLLITSFSSGQKMEWKEQAAFHTVMSQTFHPAEEGNFKPLKTRSAELTAAAKTWKNAEVPADVADKMAVKNNLNKLFTDAKALDKKIKKGASDVELKKDITGLHDTFHTIVGLCDAKEDHTHH